MPNDNKPITREMMTAYVTVLEKSVSQMALVVNTLEELNEKVNETNSHLTNGMKSEIIDEINKSIDSLSIKIEKALTTIYIIKEFVERQNDAAKELSHQAYELNKEIKEKIGNIDGDINELKTSMKVERAINIVGWSSFLLSMLAIILKLFGKL